MGPKPGATATARLDRRTTTADATRTRTPAPTVWRAFKADDAPALIDFLVDVVGFRRTAVHTDGPIVTHADPEGNFWSFGTYRGEPHPDRRPGAL